MKIITLLSLLFSVNSMADIFDQDNREESPLNLPKELSEISRSVGALVSNTRIKETNDGYLLEGIKLIEELNFCPSERFSEQSIVANCSGALISEDTYLTSAHCFDEYAFKCEDYSVVFDYNTSEFGQRDYSIGKESVYKCVDFKVNKFSGHAYGEDIAVIKLDRKVVGRKPLEVRKTRPAIDEEIYMIGYPFGITQKYTTNGRVEKYVDETSFLHHLDSFSVNSGSPIFSKETNEIIGVLVRGSGSNYVFDEVTKCKRWGRSLEENGFAHGNFATLIFE